MELRAAAIERAGGACEECRSPSNLLCLKVVNQAHGEQLELADVAAVCAPCLRGQAPPKFRARRRQMVFTPRRRS